MKWPTFPLQKKLYALFSLMLVVIVVLLIDHIQLRQETARLRRAILVVAAQPPRESYTSDDTEQNVNNLESEIDDVSNRLDDLESKVRGYDDLERRTQYLEILISRFDRKIEDIADSPGITISHLESEIQSLKSNIEKHGEYIKKIMREFNMYVPFDS